MKYGEPQSEAYNRLNLDGMRWSASKPQDQNQYGCNAGEKDGMLLLGFHTRTSLKLVVNELVGVKGAGDYQLHPGQRPAADLAVLLSPGGNPAI